MDLTHHLFHHQILDYGPQSSKTELIGCLIGHVLPLSLDMSGSRVMQKVNQNFRQINHICI